MGGRGASSGRAGGRIVESDAERFARENARVEEFLNGNASSITMENGNIIERYTQKEMKSILKEFKENQYMDDDSAIDIMYTDGTYVGYRGGDDTSKMKLSNIHTVIYGNASTTAFSGKNIKIENYNELYDNWHDDDWRVDFAHWSK